MEVPPPIKTFLKKYVWVAVLIFGIGAGIGIQAWRDSGTIATLEQRVEQLKEQPSTSIMELDKSVKSLEQRITPLTLAIPMDPLSGTISLGQGITGSGTIITEKAGQVRKFIEERKFDRAEMEISEIEKLYADFPGVLYLKYELQKAKGNTEEAMEWGQKLVRRLPSDQRLVPIYLEVANALIEKGQKAKAEAFAIEAMRLNPDDNKLRDSFKAIFGYEPSIPRRK